MDTLTLVSGLRLQQELQVSKKDVNYKIGAVGGEIGILVSVGRSW